MGRRLRQRPWTEGEHAYKQALDLSRQIGRLPETASLCRLVIAALLGRTSKKNPKEARYLKQSIALLAGVEKTIPTLSQEQLEEYATDPPSFALRFESIFRQLLLNIINSKVPRNDHDVYTLSDQRKSLNEYMAQHPVKSSASFQDYKRWLAFHSQMLYDQLGFFPCLCEYRESFKLITTNEKDLFDCHGPADLTFIILAELHQTTPSAIRKILSHSKLT